jgi:hypothetical protein
MVVQVSCFKCGQTFEHQGPAMGEVVRCPKCGQNLRLVAPSLATQKPDTTSSSRQPPTPGDKGTASPVGSIVGGRSRVVPGERPLVRWAAGLLLIGAIGAAGIGAQVFLLKKAVDLEAEKAAWQATVEQRNKEQEGVDASIAAARATLDKTKADTVHADQELAKTQTALAELEVARREVAVAKQEAGNAVAERDRAVAAKTEAEQQHADLQTKKATAKGENDQLEKQRTSLMTELASAQTQLKDVKSSLAERAILEAQVESLRREASQLSARRDAIQTEAGNAEKLKAELKNAEQEVATLRGDKAALDLRIAELKKDQQTLETQKKVSDAAATASQKTEQDSVTKAAAIKKRCDELEQERIAAEGRLRDLSKTLAGVEGELKAKQVTADQLKDVEIRLEQRKTELKTVEDNLAKARALQSGNADTKSAPSEGAK